MKGYAHYDPATMLVEVYLYADTSDGRRAVYLDGEFWRYDDPLPLGVAAKPTFTLPNDIACALRDALVEANGEPTGDAKIAALQAEVRVLREWLANLGVGDGC